MHALVTLPIRMLPFSNKRSEFYLLRLVLGLVCSICGARLYSKISNVFNPRVAAFFLIIMATSPGMFHASVAYLPSSFSMYTTMLGMAAFMDWRGGLRTAQGIFWIGAGACLGWPFAAAMAIPFVLEELMFAIITDIQGQIDFFWRVIDGAVRALLVLAAQVTVDLFFYKKLVCVPFNIVWYNIFSGGGGPNLYGTEPWHFYLRNLFLNFHVWFILALLSMPLVLVQHFFRTKGATRSSYLRSVVLLSPFYLWLLIFTIQPHKEERFMYPAYPALALNASVAIYILLANWGTTDPKDILGRIPIQLRFSIVGLIMIGTLVLSALRTLSTITAYNAPLSVYQFLEEPGGAKTGDFVCLGKEWYRFPSHYLLPTGVKAKFIKSEFSGLLPGEFSEAAGGQGFGLFPGTWLIPAGMNDENREDVGKYTNFKHCKFIVDSQLPSTSVTRLEPNFKADESNWESVQCLPFMDPVSTGPMGRISWMPDLKIVPQKLQRVWGELCLLARKKKQTANTKVNPIPNIETLG